MKKLVYFLILLSLYACKTEKQQKDEQEFIESFEPLILEKQKYILDKISKIKTSCDREGVPEKFELIKEFQHQFEKALHYEIFIDSLYFSINQVCKQENVYFDWSKNKESLFTFLELKSSYSSKDSLLTKLCLLKMGEKLIEKIAIDYQYDASFHEEYEVLKCANQQRFKKGDTLKIVFSPYTNQLKYFPFNGKYGFFLNSKKMKKPEFSILATCEDSIPCKKTITITTDYLQDFTRSYYYIVNPKK